MKYLLFPAFLLCLNTYKLNSQCTLRNASFTYGEKIEYEVVYNWGFIWISAGTVTFNVKNSNYQGKPVYHIDAFGSTFKTYDWFYKVRDNFQAYVDTVTFKPLWAERNTNDGGYKAYESYVFNEPSKKVYSAIKTSERSLHRDTLNMTACVYDVLTAAYYARNIDFSKYKPNDKIPIWMLIDGKTYPLYIRYIGKEVITGLNNQKYSCIKLASLIIEGTIFKSGEDLFVWVTTIAIIFQFLWKPR